MTIHRGDKKTPDMFSLPAAEQPLATEQEKPKTKKGVEALSPYLGTKKNRFNFGSENDDTTRTDYYKVMETNYLEAEGGPVVLIIKPEYGGGIYYGSSSKYDVELTAVVNLSVEEIKKLWRGEEPEIEPLPEYIPSTQD